MDLQVPLCKPDVGEEEIRAIREVFAAGNLSHGPCLASFEQAFARLVGTKHAVAANSWTSASFLVCCYLRERCGGGEVLMPSFTFVASANTVATAGLTPRFADVDERTQEVTAETLAPHINPRTVAIMPVHYAGRPCDMPSIMKLAQSHGLAVIEDSAECLGAMVGGRQAGSFDIGIFSFYATKNITTGEGGMVTTDRDDLADWLRLRIAHGVQKGSYQRDGVTRSWYRNAVVPGHNFRLSNFQAAMGLVQLSKLQSMNQRRHVVATRYDSGLRKKTELERPDLLPPEEHSYQMYPIRISPERRDRLVLSLQEAGTGASVHFDPPVHWQVAYFQKHVSLPVTERLARSVITLPISPVQTAAQTDKVLEAIHRFNP